MLLCSVLAGCSAGNGGRRPSSSAKVQLVEPAPPPRTVSYEGMELTLERVVFVGNDAAPIAELRAVVMASTAREIGAEVLERDVLLIAAWYYDHGYIEARVDDAKVTRLPGGSAIEIHFSTLAV